MMRRNKLLPMFGSESIHPKYELRSHYYGAGDVGLEVWQVPSSATPHLKKPKKIASLRGRNYALVEHRVIRRLSQAGIDITDISRISKKKWNIDEEQALRIGLLFRLLAPMRSRSSMVQCAQAVESMGKEEAAYWLGMAMYRKHPRRVLTALRHLLDDPSQP